MPPKRISSKGPNNPSPPPLDAWRGCANSWECDELDHLNIQFYLAKWSESLASLAAAAGMPDAFKARAGATLKPLDVHVRYHAEARPGASLLIRAGVLEQAESQARVYAEMRHGDGRLAATFVARLAHQDPRSGAHFPWPKRVSSGLTALRCELPDHASPRGLNLQAPRWNAIAAADRDDLVRAGLSMLTAQDVDAFGKARPDALLGRCSDGASVVLPAGHELGDVSAAMVELHMRFLAWPVVGDRVEHLMALHERTQRTATLGYWLIDPHSKRSWAEAETVLVALDLSERRAVPIPDAMLARLVGANAS